MQGRDPIFRPLRRRFVLVVVALIPLLLAGCVTPGEQASGQSDFVDLIREVDLRPPAPQRVKAGALTSQQSTRAVAYYGDGSPAKPGTQQRTAARDEADPTTTGAIPNGAQEKASNKGYEINFENT